MAETADASLGTRPLSEADFAVPLGDRWFEDYPEGAVYEYGYTSVTADEIVEFARRFDPQLMHVDPEWAATGPFGGLIASGWHTAGIFMRLYADHYLSRVATLPSPGIDELRWPSPLRPGDRVRLQTTIVESRRSRSKPDRGLVRTHAELLDSGGRTVLSLVAMNLFTLREPASG
ncbi:MAG TPA: MaoC family dehydratase [Streptosporangiaceae bacterium]